MKTVFMFILFLFPFGRIFAADETAPELMSHEGYKNNVNAYCKLEGDIPNKGQLWIDWKNDNLIKMEQVTYADIRNAADGDKVYKEYLGKIKADPSRIDIL